MKKAKKRAGGKQSEVPSARGDRSGQQGIRGEQVYGLIKEALMAGLLAPGTAITGRSIAQGLGISPTPVRDALKRLEADGVVEGRSKSAYCVNELTRETYIEILNLRCDGPEVAVALAAETATPDDVRYLENVNAKYIVARSMTESIKLNYLFHFGVYKLARSAVLREVIANLWSEDRPVHAPLPAVLQGQRRRQQSRPDYCGAGRRDPEGAAAALRKDLNEAIKVIAPRLPSPAVAGLSDESVTLPTVAAR